MQNSVLFLKVDTVVLRIHLKGVKHPARVMCERKKAYLEHISIKFQLCVT